LIFAGLRVCRVDVTLAAKRTRGNLTGVGLFLSSISVGRRKMESTWTVIANSQIAIVERRGGSDSNVRCCCL
jgi:hypothetical protein